VSGVGTALDININDPDNELKWLTGGGVSYKPLHWKKFESPGSAKIMTAGPATKIIDACMASNQITAEAWIKPGTTGQAGPARAITISSSSGSRNITVSYQHKYYHIRCRTTDTDGNGLPATINKKDNLYLDDLHHFVFTYSNPGSKMYKNSVDIPTEARDGTWKKDNMLTGTFSNWVATFKLVLFNEYNAPRAFWGDLHLVAFYDRALSAAEVKQNYDAGYGAK
jgi:hypothetical protein